MSRRPHVRKQYWNEPEMGLWEKAYLPEILRGLFITGGVFLRNMAKWMTGRKGALTTYYPEETRADYAPANRGKHVCPARVIEIEAGFDPADAAHPKFPVRFEIDYSRCVFCGLCVEACPEDAIRMAKEVPDLPAADRWTMWLGREELLAWQPQSDVAKPYPPAPKAPQGDRP
jgi:NADH-quinone oxidoreductase subunit I